MPELTASEERIAARVAELLDVRRPKEQAINRKHYEFIEMLMLKEVRKQERHEVVMTHIAKWGAVSLLTGTALGLFIYFKDLLHK